MDYKRTDVYDKNRNFLKTLLEWDSRQTRSCLKYIPDVLWSEMAELWADNLFRTHDRTTPYWIPSHKNDSIHTLDFAGRVSLWENVVLYNKPFIRKLIADQLNISKRSNIYMDEFILPKNPYYIPKEEIRENDKILEELRESIKGYYKYIPIRVSADWIERMSKKIGERRSQEARDTIIADALFPNANRYGNIGRYIQDIPLYLGNTRVGKYTMSPDNHFSFRPEINIDRLPNYSRSNIEECINTERIQSLLRIGGWFGEFDHPTEEWVSYGD